MRGTKKPPMLINTIKRESNLKLGETFWRKLWTQTQTKGDKSFAVVLSSVAPEQHDKRAEIYRGPN